MIRSPITLTGNTKFEYSIECRKIIENYRAFNIDVSKYFAEINEISVYRCLDTDYRFFYPTNVSGDSSFYEQLQKFEWYYMPWKWEHGQAEEYLLPNMRILEVGCGNGAFIEKVKDKVTSVVGLELNQRAVERGQKRGITILNESIEQHSEKFEGTYDLVCSFQVLEHIADVRSFLEASVRLLKTNGILVVSVPNDNSFLGLDTNYLNMPPHHMGLWSEEALRNISSIFNLKFRCIHFEPLQQYHHAYFVTTMVKYFVVKYKRVGRILRFLLPLIIPKVVKFFPFRLKAYTIQAVYEKMGKPWTS